MGWARGLVQPLACATEGTENQWVQVPPEHVSVQLGSYPGGESGQPPLLKPRRHKVHKVRRASLWAVTRVNPEQASKVRDVDADSALTGGRPPRGGEAPTHAAATVHRGRGNGTWGWFAVATWEARVRRVIATLDITSRWWSARVSERPIILMKRRNGRGGKGPHFWVLLKEPRTGRLA
jgi:hypothetical protein